MTEADGHIGQLLDVHFGNELLIIFKFVVRSAKIKHGLISWMPLLPQGDVKTLDIVEIVFKQFAATPARDAHQLNLALHRCLAVDAGLDNVLLAAARRLHHLVDCAVTPLLEISLAEDLSELVQDIGAMIKTQLLVVGSSTQSTRRAFIFLGIAVATSIAHR